MAAVAASSGRIAQQGDEVMVRYLGRLQDGKVFDATQEGGKPFTFKLGAGEVVPGFDRAVLGLAAGKKVSVTVPPAEAYGEHREDRVYTVPAARVPAGLREGLEVELGSGVRARVIETKSDGSVVIDANHMLAGKTLTFDIELVGFKLPLTLGMEMIGWGGKPVQVPTAIATSEVSQIFETPDWPDRWPYTESDFSRQDESSDSHFYNSARLVEHIDEAAIAAIRSFYAVHFAQAPQGEYSVLDICSSWISHYPQDLQATRVAITGMSDPELARNKQATEYVAKDLNADPKLPYGDNEFDFITNVVSVDYLGRPREVFQEMYRVMKPGGVAIMSFSNRCFPTKAIAMWVADMNDGPGHCQIVGNYFRFSPEGGWKNIAAVDISPKPGRSDPVWVVLAVKA